MTPTREARKLAQHLANLMVRQKPLLKLDGIIGPKSKARFRAALGVDLQKDRLVAGIIQEACSWAGRPDPVPRLKQDFWYGPATEAAAETWWALVSHKPLPDRPDEKDTGKWQAPWKPKAKCYKPSDRQMIKAYGEPGSFLATFRIPFPVRLAWDPSTIVTRMTMHETLVDRTHSALRAIGKHYGEEDRIRLGLDLFGGSYNKRRKRGGSTWSAHAFGAALDWDPDHNRLRWGKDRARLARPEYRDWWQIWEAHGFTGLGPCFNFDWMHVQANP